MNHMLFILCKNTKFQSNSQLSELPKQIRGSCLSSAKIQNFKAIHNRPNRCPLLHSLFILCKNTKFQSNSQQLFTMRSIVTSCLSSAKIQNFKAIHNGKRDCQKDSGVVYPLQKYKISKQFTTCLRFYLISL